MSPRDIVKRARRAGLNAIALSDHNCAFNLSAFSEVCREAGMECLYGMEVTTVEEAHMLCLFDDLNAALELGECVYDSLPDIPNQPERFGDQPIVDASDNIIGSAEKYLISASGFDISSLLEQVHSMGGLFVPAHIDRMVFGVIAQLGFLPDEDFDAVELTARGKPELARGFPILRNSDSHCLETIGGACSEFDLERLDVPNLKAFLASRRGGSR